MAPPESDGVHCVSARESGKGRPHRCRIRQGSRIRETSKLLKSRVCTLRFLACVLLVTHWGVPTAHANANIAGHGVSRTSGQTTYASPKRISAPAIEVQVSQVSLETPYPVAEGSTSSITVAAVNPSLLALTQEGSPVDVTECLQVGDEIVSVDEVPAWQLGAHGVQALVNEAGTDWLSLTVQRAEPSGPGTLISTLVKVGDIQGDLDLDDGVHGDSGLECSRMRSPTGSMRNWAYSVCKSIDAHEKILDVIERRCQHFPVSTRDIARALDLVLRPHGAPPLESTEEEEEAEDEEKLVDAAVDRVVQDLSGHHRQAILEVAFATLLAVTIAHCGSGVASENEDTVDIIGKLVGGMTAAGMTRSSNTLDMLTVTLLYRLWPDAEFPPFTFPLQHKFRHGWARMFGAEVLGHGRGRGVLLPARDGGAAEEGAPGGGGGGGGGGGAPVDGRDGLVELLLLECERSPAVVSKRAADAIVAAAAVPARRRSAALRGQEGGQRRVACARTRSGSVDLERAREVLQRMWAVGVRPTNGAQQLLLAVARESLSVAATCVPTTQARQVLQLVRQGQVALTSSCATVFLRSLATALLSQQDFERGGKRDMSNDVHGQSWAGAGGWGVGQAGLLGTPLSTLVGVLELCCAVLDLDADEQWWVARMHTMAVAVSLGAEDIAEADALLERAASAGSLTSGVIAAYTRLAKSDAARSRHAQELFLRLAPHARCADSYSAAISSLSLHGDSSAALDLLEEVNARSSSQAAADGGSGGEGRIQACVLGSRVYTAALRACDNPALILDVHQKMVQRGFGLDAESAALVAAARRYVEAEKDVRAVIKHANYIQRQTNDAVTLRNTLRQRQKDRRITPPPPDYTEAPPDYPALDHKMLKVGGLDNIPQHGTHADRSDINTLGREGEKYVDRASLSGMDLRPAAEMEGEAEYGDMEGTAWPGEERVSCEDEEQEQDKSEEVAAVTEDEEVQVLDEMNEVDAEHIEFDSQPASQQMQQIGDSALQDSDVVLDVSGQVAAVTEDEEVLVLNEVDEEHIECDSQPASDQMQQIGDSVLQDSDVVLDVSGEEEDAAAKHAIQDEEIFLAPIYEEPEHEGELGAVVEERLESKEDAYGVDLSTSHLLSRSPSPFPSLPVSLALSTADGTKDDHLPGECVPSFQESDSHHSSVVLDAASDCVASDSVEQEFSGDIPDHGEQVDQVYVHTMVKERESYVDQGLLVSQLGSHHAVVAARDKELKIEQSNAFPTSPPSGEELVDGEEEERVQEKTGEIQDSSSAVEKEEQENFEESVDYVGDVEFQDGLEVEQVQDESEQTEVPKSDDQLVEDRELVDYETVEVILDTEEDRVVEEELEGVQCEHVHLEEEQAGGEGWQAKEEEEQEEDLEIPEESDMENHRYIGNSVQSLSMQACEDHNQEEIDVASDTLLELARGGKGEEELNVGISSFTVGVGEDEEGEGRRAEQYDVEVECDSEGVGGGSIDVGAEEGQQRSLTKSSSILEDVSMSNDFIIEDVSMTEGVLGEKEERKLGDIVGVGDQAEWEEGGILEVGMEEREEGREGKDEEGLTRPRGKSPTSGCFFEEGDFESDEENMTGERKERWLATEVKSAKGVPHMAPGVETEENAYTSAKEDVGHDMHMFSKRREHKDDILAVDDEEHGKQEAVSREGMERAEQEEVVGDSDMPEHGGQVDQAYVHTLVKEGEKYVDQGYDVDKGRTRDVHEVLTPLEEIEDGAEYGDSARAVWVPTLRVDNVEDETLLQMEEEEEEERQREAPHFKEESATTQGEDDLVKKLHQEPALQEEGKGRGFLCGEDEQAREIGGMKGRQQQRLERCSGRWSEAEERRLAMALELYGPKVKGRWELIAEAVGSRNAKQAKRHAADPRFSQIHAKDTTTTTSSCIRPATANVVPIENEGKSVVREEVVEEETGIQVSADLGNEVDSDMPEHGGQVDQAYVHTLVKEGEKYVDQGYDVDKGRTRDVHEVLTPLEEIEDGAEYGDSARAVWSQVKTHVMDTSVLAADEDEKAELQGEDDVPDHGEQVDQAYVDTLVKEGEKYVDQGYDVDMGRTRDRHEVLTPLEELEDGAEYYGDSARAVWVPTLRENDVDEETLLQMDGEEEEEDEQQPEGEEVVGDSDMPEHGGQVDQAYVHTLVKEGEKYVDQGYDVDKGRTRDVHEVLTPLEEIEDGAEYGDSARAVWSQVKTHVMDTSVLAADEDEKAELQGEDDVPDHGEQVDQAYIHTLIKKGESYVDQGLDAQLTRGVGVREIGLREASEDLLMLHAYGDPQRSVWHPSRPIQDEKKAERVDKRKGDEELIFSNRLQLLKEDGRINEVASLFKENCATKEEEPDGDVPALRNEATNLRKREEEVMPLREAEEGGGSRSGLEREALHFKEDPATAKSISSESISDYGSLQSKLGGDSESEFCTDDSCHSRQGYRPWARSDEYTTTLPDTVLSDVFDSREDSGQKETEETDGELHRQIQGVLADLATTKDETETRGNYFGAVRKEREIVGDLRGSDAMPNKEHLESPQIVYSSIPFPSCE